MEKMLLTVSESALLSGLSKTYIRELLYKSNELKYIKSGTKYLISRDSINEYIEKHLEGGAK